MHIFSREKTSIFINSLEKISSHSGLFGVFRGHWWSKEIFLGGQIEYNKIIELKKKIQDPIKIFIL